MDYKYILSKIFTWEIVDDCWNITSHKLEPQGYAPIQFKRKRTRAHRLAYELTKGEIFLDDIIRHTCDNKACINPDHLVAGNKHDNMIDMINRNRQSDWSDRKGKRGKLKKQEVVEIFYSNESSYQLSKKYNVTDVQIRRIRNGTRYKSITKLL